MMGAGASSALTETKGAVTTLCGGSVRWPGAILWSLNSLSLAVHIRTIAGALDFGCVGFGPVCGRWICVGLRWGLSLRSDLLRKQDSR
jgi:hypothetical protein